MTSGVTVQQEVIEQFTEIKMKHRYRYILCKLTTDMKEICVEKCADKSATYDDFLTDLYAARDAGECRYAFYDAEYTLPNGQQRDKLIFILWSPEVATMKQKMLYSSSKDAIKKRLVGFGKEIQATDDDEISWPHVLEICQSTDR